LGFSQGGVTPPAGLWILSAENFYYGAFYMLSQLGLNLDGQGTQDGELRVDQVTSCMIKIAEA